MALVMPVTTCKNDLLIGCATGCL